MPVLLGGKHVKRCVLGKCQTVKPSPRQEQRDARKPPKYESGELRLAPRTPEKSSQVQKHLKHWGSRWVQESLLRPRSPWSSDRKYKQEVENTPSAYEAGSKHLSDGGLNTHLCGSNSSESLPYQKNT